MALRFGFLVCTSGALACCTYMTTGTHLITLMHSRQGVRPEDVGIYLVFAAVYLALAVYFVAGAPHLVQFSYRETPDERDEKEDV